MNDDCVIPSLRFPQKLWRIVHECKSGAIRWSAAGTTILLDYKKFQDEYLDSSNVTFKTTNITSFIRQLNLYGFRKVTSHNRDPCCNSRNPDVHEFLHEHFRIGRLDLLSRVCRKTSVKTKIFEKTAIKIEIPEPDETEEQQNSSSSEENRMTRLQMCQIALTKALEQATVQYLTEKYKFQHSNEGVQFSSLGSEHIDSSLQDSNDLELPAENVAVIEWMEQDSETFIEDEDFKDAEENYNWENTIFTIPNETVISIPYSSF